MVRMVVKTEPNTMFLDFIIVSPEWYEEMSRTEYAMGHINTAEDFWSKAEALRNKEREANGESKTGRVLS